MESEDVLILGVDSSAECLCLGRKRVDKGKGAADPSRRRLKKSPREDKRFGSCLVILDGDSGSEDDYLEVYGDDMVKKDPALPDSTTADTAADLQCLVSVPKRLKVFESGGGGERETGPAAIHSDHAASGVLPRLADLDDLLLRTETKPAHSVFSTPPTTTSTNNTTMLPPSQQASENSPPLATATTTTTPNTARYGSSHLSSLDPSSSEEQLTPDKESSKAYKGTASLSEHMDTGTKDLGGGRGLRIPTCWTNCPNCPPSKQTKYHLIDVAYNCAEWSVVSDPLIKLGFTVTRVQRIQNETLWQRLCFEKQLMLRDHHEVNEQFLYHTSRCAIATICEEGLDMRLSMNGNFGRGIYFR